MTDEPVEGAGVTWREVREHAGATGLLPVLLDARRDSSGARRPWDSGELDPSLLHLIDWVDPADALRAGWAGDEELDAPGERGWLAGLVEPWGPQFPGLALAEAGRLDGVTVRAALAAVPPAWIGLVHAARPADVVTALGWPGASSAGTVLGAPARLSAVLRSWEDRFGAHLFRLGFDTVQLLVERPRRRRRRRWPWPPSTWPLPGPAASGRTRRSRQ